MVLLPIWRPTGESGALKAGTGPECQVLLFLISDAGWEKEAQISLPLSLRWGEGPNFQEHRTRLWHCLLYLPWTSLFPFSQGSPAGKILKFHGSLPPYFAITISCHLRSSSKFFYFSLPFIQTIISRDENKYLLDQGSIFSRRVIRYL